MQQIRITRTANLNGVLSFLKERYPLFNGPDKNQAAIAP